MKKEKGAFSGKEIILGISGSIAAYKAADIARKFKMSGAAVTVVFTPAALKFIGKHTLSSLTERPVYSDIFEDRPWDIAHRSLAQAADMVVVAPASADILAKLANGIADNLLCAIILATKSDVLIAPAMYEPMWKHPATQANAEKLRDYGYHFIGPVRGPLASGDVMTGRMADPEAIIKAADKILNN